MSRREGATHLDLEESDELSSSKKTDLAILHGVQFQGEVICNLGENDKIISCAEEGISCTQQDGCLKQMRMDLAGRTIDSACSTVHASTVMCQVWRLASGSVVGTVSSSKGSMQCCLCPPGKNLDVKNNMCVTRDITTIEEDGQTLVLAGSSPETACRTWSYLTTACPSTARSDTREKVTLPREILGQETGYCCICPEKSVYVSVSKKCLCGREDDDFSGDLEPVNRTCKFGSLDEKTRAEAQGDPALKAINEVRNECWKRHVLRELLDPHQTKDVAVRVFKSESTAFTIGKIKLLSLHASTKFDRRGGAGVSLAFQGSARFHVGFENLVLYTSGRGATILNSVSGEGEISGEELLANIGNSDSSGRLQATLRLNNRVMGLDLESLLTNRVMPWIMSVIFRTVGQAYRGVSVEGYLRSAMQGRSIYPIHLELNTKTGTGYGEEDLHLEVAFAAGKREEEPSTNYGVSLQKLSLTNMQATRDGDRIEAHMEGTLSLDVAAGIEQFSNELKSATLGLAYGAGTQPEVEDEFFDVETGDNDTDDHPSMLMQRPGNAQTCEERIRERSREVVAAGIKGIRSGIGLVSRLYRKVVTAKPDTSGLPTEPGRQRGDWERRIFELWQEKRPEQKGFQLARDETRGLTFTMYSVKDVVLVASGEFGVAKDEDGHSIILGTLEVQDLNLTKLRHDSCKPNTNDPTNLELCWQPHRLTGNEGIDIQIAPNQLEVRAVVEPSGQLEVCVQFAQSITLTGTGKLPSGLSLLSRRFWGARFVEEALELKLAEILYNKVIVEQQGFMITGAGSVLSVQIAPDRITFDWAVFAKLSDRDRIQARIASQGATNAHQPGFGGAWWVLESNAMKQLDLPGDGARLEESYRKFTYDPAEWLKKGAGIYGHVKELDIQGSLSYEAHASQPGLELHGEIVLDLGALLRAKESRRFDLLADGAYCEGSAKIWVKDDSGNEGMMEAVLSCGYLVLKTADAKSEKYRLDLTQDSEDSSVEIVDEGDRTHLLCTPKSKGAVVRRLHLFIDQNSSIWTAVRYELAKKEEMNRMMHLDDYKSSNPWREMDRLKLGPFQWTFEPSDSISQMLLEHRCRAELKRCGDTFECLGVSLEDNECTALSSYDLELTPPLSDEDGIVRRAVKKFVVASR